MEIETEEQGQKPESVNIKYEEGRSEKPKRKRGRPASKNGEFKILDESFFVKGEPLIMNEDIMNIPIDPVFENENDEMGMEEELLLRKDAQSKKEEKDGFGMIPEDEEEERKMTFAMDGENEDDDDLGDIDSVGSISSRISDHSVGSSNDAATTIGEEQDWIPEFQGLAGERWLPEYKKLKPTKILQENEDYFKIFFTDELFQSISDETNKYARKRIIDLLPPDTPNPIDALNSKWKDSNAEEIKNFVGCVLLMGLLKKPSYTDYWSKDPMIRTDIFRQVISSNRFIQILKYLHLASTKPSLKAYMINKDNRLEKVQPILSYLLRQWQMYKPPNQNLAIDESMISFQGKIIFKQYIPRKRHRWGIKAWVMADSTSGYVHEMQIYTGRSGVQEGANLGMKVVLDLSKGLEPGHVLFFDNYFTSYQLMEELTKRKLGAVGMVKKDRQGLPKSFYASKLEDDEVKYIKNRNNENIKALVWKKKKPIFCMSNFLGTQGVDLQKYCKKTRGFIMKKTPEIIAIYSKYMHGVDKIDQLGSYYSFKRKSAKWWKQVFFYLLEVSISNSYVIYIENYEKGKKRPMSRKHFRIEIIKNLFNNNKKYKEFMSRKPNLDQASHFPLRSGRDLGCQWCKVAKNRRKRSRYYCEKCMVTLCVLCFKPFHEGRSYLNQQ